MPVTAADILATPKAEAGALLGTDAATITKRFRNFAKAFHPDHSTDPDAAAVFAHINLLRKAALAGGAPPRERPAQFQTFSHAGKTWRYHYKQKHMTDAGQMLIGTNSLAICTLHEWDDLLNAAPTLSFADDKMRNEMARFLPALEKAHKTDQGQLHIYRRTPDQVLLADLIQANGGKLEPVHVAWMISGMLNLACYFGWADMIHGDLGPQTLLISPKYHSVALTGPLLYAVQNGRRPKALPKRTLDAAPRLAIKGETANPGVDLALVRRTALEALGDPFGSKILRDTAIPKPFAMWLLTPPKETAIADYAGWEKARDQAFGPPKFVTMTTSAEAVYA